MSKYFKRFGKPVPVPNPDTTPPTTPTGLSATAANPSVLSLLGLSTDNVAVTGYQIWRKLGSGGTYAQIGTTNSWPWTDPTVVNGNTYFWESRAFDGAGNFSGFCTPATASIPSGLLPDTTSPLTPGGAPSQVSVGTNTATISLPLVTDSTVNSGTQVVSGMQQYLVKVNGTVTGAPVTQPSASLTFAAGMDIGTPSPSGTDADVSGTYTLTCGGVLWGGTADQLHLVAGQVNGDFDLSARIVSVASSTGNAFSKCGIIARDGSDPAAQYFAMLSQTGSTGLDGEYRTPAGTSANWSGALLTHALPYYVKISRRGNAFTGFVSSDGSTWGSAILTQVIPMATTVNVGLACSANISSSTVTAVVDTVTFTAGAAVDFVDTFSGSSSPSARLYTYAGVDNAGNIGTYSPSLSVTPTATSGGTIKNFPGHYLIANIRGQNNPTNYSSIQASINDIVWTWQTYGQGPVGLQLELIWSLLETPAGGNYYFKQSDPNYNSNNPIDATLAMLATASTTLGFDLKLILYLPGIDSVVFHKPTTPQAIPYSTAGNSLVSSAPDYIINAGYAFMDASGQLAARVWQTGYGTAFINWVNALGAQYDSNSHIAAIIPVYETAVNASTLDGAASDPTYSLSAMSAFFVNLQSAMSISWPTTFKPFFGNYGWNVAGNGVTNAQFNTVMQSWIPSLSAGKNPGFGFGGPDILYQADDGAPTQGDQVLRGLIGSQDYRGIIGVLYEEQADDGVWNDQTSAGVESYAYNTLMCTHVVWEDQSGGSNPSAYYRTGIVPALNAVGWRIHSTKPSSFT